MKFKYQPTLSVDTKGRFIKRPIVILEILDSNGNFVDHALGLIDSGADRTAVHMSYAPEIGLNFSLTKINEVAGVSNDIIPGLLASVRFRIKDTNEEFEVPVNFIDSDHIDVLLGQEGFFDNYKITFEKDHDSFEIVRVKK